LWRVVEPRYLLVEIRDLSSSQFQDGEFHITVSYCILESNGV